MFGPLVAATTLLLGAQGVFELVVRREPLGALLLAVAILVGSAGVIAAMAGTERRRGR